MINLKCTAIVAVSFFCSIHLVPHRTFGQDQQSSARIVDRLARIRNLATLPDPIVQPNSETKRPSTDSRIADPTTVHQELSKRRNLKVPPKVNAHVFNATSTTNTPNQDTMLRSIRKSRSESKSPDPSGKVAVTWLTDQPRRVQGVVPPQSDSQPQLQVDNANVPQTPDLNVGQVRERSEPQGQLPDVVEPELPNQWPRRTILETRIDIRDFSQTRPKDRSAELIGKSQSEWSMFSPPQSIFTWAAPNIRYQPLYYQDIALERYGQTACGLRQSALSAIHFFTSTAFLPYSIYQDPPRCCEYPLGYCRPGDPVPRICQRPFWGFSR